MSEQATQEFWEKMAYDFDDMQQEIPELVRFYICMRCHLELEECSCES